MIGHSAGEEGLERTVVRNGATYKVVFNRGAYTIEVRPHVKTLVTRELGSMNGALALCEEIHKGMVLEQMGVFGDDQTNT